jgi:hypothetical protein
MIATRLRHSLYILIVIICLLTILYYNLLLNEQSTSLTISKSSFIQFESNQVHEFSQGFDINKNVLIFVHAQKTGGSDFDRGIIKHLLVQDKKTKQWKKACRNVSTSESFDTFQARRVKFKKFECAQETTSHGYNESRNWYFSRQTFGWSCGLHADFSQIKKCVPKFYPNRNPKHDFRYFTILREPVKRFISEWLHVRRGATWLRKPLSLEQQCLNDHYKKCFKGTKNWSNVTLKEFISCKSNLAKNRQTRMLANFDSKFTTCDYLNQSSIEKDTELLKRAKSSLENQMTFFALNEFQYFSMILFQKTFNDLFRFDEDFKQSNSSLSETILKALDSNIVTQIENINDLDLKLYKFAVNLFFKRLEFHRIFY